MGGPPRPFHWLTTRQMCCRRPSTAAVRDMGCDTVLPRREELELACPTAHADSRRPVGLHTMLSSHQFGRSPYGERAADAFGDVDDHGRVADDVEAERAA